MKAMWRYARYALAGLGLIGVLAPNDESNG